MTNRLQSEISPYLLQHADNPVDWYPWGDEAFTFAKGEDKPIFLSVGYAACHWCHVMARESFEDQEIAALMNEHFVNIKVDREERPDVDSIYMDAVVALTGMGGWPMSVFLTPDGKPFYGGTYFPPEPRHNLPSFGDILIYIAKQWHENRQELIADSTKLTEIIASSSSLLSTAGSITPNTLDRAAETLFKTYDWSRGGWGGAPKFPQATAIDFLIHKHHRDQDKLALDMAIHALYSMARGGIYDHLTGGFHRYAVDANWRVPHFEKMLYDNALLAKVYLHAWQVTGEKSFLRVVEETLDFLIREMRHPEGGFFSALDADSEGEEGKFYTWELEEIRNELVEPGLADLFIQSYGLSEAGNFEGKNVLHLPGESKTIVAPFQGMTDEEIHQLASARAILLSQRETRIRPAADEKVLTSWNGLVLSTLAEAARVMDHGRYLETAQSLAGFLVDHMIVDGQLMRSWRWGQARYPAYLEDHAALGEGLLALYQADFNTYWFKVAIQLAEEILDHFWDPQGGFFDTRDDSEKLIARPKSLQDSPIPSGNSLAITLLLKLAALTGENRFADPAEVMLKAIRDNTIRYPTSFAGWLTAMDFSLGPQLQLALVGSHEETAFKRLAQVVNRRFLPRLIVAGADPNSDDAPALIYNRPMVNGLPSAYLCQEFTCKLPTTSPSILQEQIEEMLLTSTRATSLKYQ